MTMLGEVAREVLLRRSSAVGQAGVVLVVGLQYVSQPMSDIVGRQLDSSNLMRAGH